VLWECGGRERDWVDVKGRRGVGGRRSGGKKWWEERREAVV